jgi:hypothetical protein
LRARLAKAFGLCSRHIGGVGYPNKVKRIRLMPVLIVVAGVAWAAPRLSRAIQLSISGKEVAGETIRNIPNTGGDLGSCPVVQFTDSFGVKRLIYYGSCMYPELPIGTKVRVLYKANDPSVAIVKSPENFMWPVFALALSLLFASLLGWTEPKKPK